MGAPAADQTAGWTVWSVDDRKPPGRRDAIVRRIAPGVAEDVDSAWAEAIRTAAPHEVIGDVTFGETEWENAYTSEVL